MNKLFKYVPLCFKTRKFLYLFSVIFVLILFPALSFAADYYVSPTGSATWANCSGSTPLNGTSACSWQTAMANAVAGDTVYFRSGDYDPGTPVPYPNCNRELPIWNPANSGTAANPITFMAYPGEVPNVLKTHSCGAALFGARGRSYIVWDGFSATLTGNTADILEQDNFLVVIWLSDNITIRNSDLRGMRSWNNRNNILIRVERSRYITIENNRLHDNNGYLNTDPEYIQEPQNTSAVQLYYTAHIVVRNNDIYNNINGIFDKDNGNYNEFYNNHIWGGTEYTRCDYGIRLMNQLATLEFGPGTDDRVYQNIIRNCKFGIVTDDSAPLIYNAKIYNNVIYGGTYTIRSSSTGIYIMTQARNFEIYNNIISNNYPWQLRYYAGDSMPSYSNYNDFYASSLAWNLSWSTTYTTLSSWTAATGFDATSITSNPLFVNAGGASPADYKLQASSPARTSGRGGSYATVMGAYITGNEIIGYTSSTSPILDTQSPSIPANLSATSISTSQINLSWTASTDNVGVSGYRIYRCTGAGCIPSTQIATSATNSYQNTGLAANTTYVYRVAAYDAAGNVSSQSSSATATTQAGTDTTPPSAPTGLAVQ